MIESRNKSVFFKLKSSPDICDTVKQLDDLVDRRVEVNAIIFVMRLDNLDIGEAAHCFFLQALQLLSVEDHRSLVPVFVTSRSSNIKVDINNTAD